LDSFRGPCRAADLEGVASDGCDDVPARRTDRRINTAPNAAETDFPDGPDLQG